ncbi:hypothetical protein WG66_007964 [Moniliophthora roreri]|nr:hypothetical protein WG66_007964 [Moniliophthora roreri]
MLPYGTYPPQQMYGHGEYDMPPPLGPYYGGYYDPSQQQLPSATRTRTIPAESESWAESQCSSQFLHRYRHLILEDTQTLIQRITHRGVWGTTAAAAAAPTPGRDISPSGGYQAYARPPSTAQVPSSRIASLPDKIQLAPLRATGHGGIFTSWRRYLEPEQAISADMHGTTMLPRLLRGSAADTDGGKRAILFAMGDTYRPMLRLSRVPYHSQSSCFFPTTTSRT